jgi:rsbT antagonist protein RsbS
VSRIPVIRVEDVLIATVLEDVTDSDALAFQSELGRQLEVRGAKGVLIDLSVVGIVDSFLGRVLAEVATMSRLLGAPTVIAGIQPAVAVTLVELGVRLGGVRTALTSDAGMRMLRDGSPGGRHVGRR